MATQETAIDTKQKAPGLRALLRNANFRNLWLGQIISDFGDSLTMLALLILVNRLTGSAAALATMLIVLTVPQVTFGLIAGVYVDRLDRKRIMIVSDVLRGALVLGFIVVTSADWLWVMYLISFLQASVGTLFTPARSALIPNIVDKESLLAANSISQTSRVIFGVLGTAAAGVLIGVFGTVWPAFAFDAFTFFASALLISRIRVPEHARKVVTAVGSASVRAIFGQLGDGIKLILHTRILAGTLVAAGVTMLGLGAVNVLLVPLVINDLQLQPTWFGLVEFAQTVAMVLSGSMVAVIAARLKPSSIISTGLMLTGLLIAGIAAAGNIIVLIGIIFGVGLFVTPVQASISTILQTNVANEMRGRIGAALNTLVSTSSLLSMALAGVLAEVVGVRNVFVLGGGLTILAGIASAVVFRPIGRRAESEPAPNVEEGKRTPAAI